MGRRPLAPRAGAFKCPAPQWVAAGLPVGNESDDHIRAAIAQQQLDFRDNAPTTAAQAASIILDGVRQDRWRILVGEDAHILDELVREEPEAAMFSPRC